MFENHLLQTAPLARKRERGWGVTRGIRAACRARGTVLACKPVRALQVRAERSCCHLFIQRSVVMDIASGKIALCES